MRCESFELWHHRKILRIPLTERVTIAEVMRRADAAVRRLFRKLSNLTHYTRLWYTSSKMLEEDRLRPSVNRRQLEVLNYRYGLQRTENHLPMR